MRRGSFARAQTDTKTNLLVRSSAASQLRRSPSSMIISVGASIGRGTDERKLRHPSFEGIRERADDGRCLA
ncbi:hypothetical protein CN934_26915 [Ensifer sp. MMN_5]|nr:hypothetical protein CN934_26915 [Ensifer sp. MMN_5]